jgi:hypothetical protein
MPILPFHIVISLNFDTHICFSLLYFTLLYFTSLDRCGYTDQKFRDLVTQLQQLTEENQMFRSDRIQLNRQLHQKVGK